MHVSIIANGFQEEYIYNLLNNFPGKLERLDFIGSSIYHKNRIDPKINIYNLRGDHDENSNPIKKIIRILVYYSKLMGYLLKYKPDVIHLQWLRFDLIEGIMFPLLMRLLGIKVVYTAHNMLPHHKYSPYYQFKYKLLYKIQNEIIVHTQFIKSKMIEDMKIDERKIHVVHHGVYKVQKDIAITKKAARRYLGLGESSTVLLFFGKIVEYKGLDILIESIEKLKNTSFEILVAGRVSGEFKPKFEQLMHGGKQGKYKCLLKYLSEEDIEYCFKAADVTVLPYKEASQSGVLFMSYAFGRPVIVPDLGNFSADVVPVKTGYVFKPFDSESLAEKLIQFRMDWKEAGDKEYQFIMDFAEHNYSWDLSCQKMVTVYKN